IGIARSATTQTSPSEPNATGAENRAATLPPDRVTTAGASAVTVETIVVVTDSARKGEDATIVEAAATGIAPNATTRTSPSEPSATVVVNLGAMLEARLETTAEVELTDATTTAVAVSTVGVDATATVAATKRSLETGPATTAGPTISPAAPRATSADRTRRTVAVTDAAHVKAEASVAEIDAVAIDEGPGNHATLAAGTAVDQGKTVRQGGKATSDQGALGRRSGSPKESLAGMLITARQEISRDDDATGTIEGESHGRGRVPRCP
ncbi:MAG: hypothetical protein VX011_02405, partial [Candidatus Thermoplasmatota archaeon]|nr:hypothetical protein [Candidatus Thermoplasmatota archaeon]